MNKFYREFKPQKVKYYKTFRISLLAQEVMLIQGCLTKCIESLLQCWVLKLTVITNAN